MSKRAIVVFNPFEIKSYKQKKINKKNLRIISFVGSDKPQKGLNYFLAIANTLIKDIKDRPVFLFLEIFCKKKK